jgi:hypothetical protein
MAVSDVVVSIYKMYYRPCYYLISPVCCLLSASTKLSKHVARVQGATSSMAIDTGQTYRGQWHAVAGGIC